MNGHSVSQNVCPSASSQFQQQSPEQLLQVYGFECHGPSIKKIRQRYANRNENSHKLITAINKNCQATEPANARRLLLQLVDIGRMHHAACTSMAITMIQPLYSIPKATSHQSVSIYQMCCSSRGRNVVESTFCQGEGARARVLWEGILGTKPEGKEVPVVKRAFRRNRKRKNKQTYF